MPGLAAEGSPADVVVITIDTLRADHLGCYGDRAIATPNLDALGPVCRALYPCFHPRAHYAARPHGALHRKFSHGHRCA